MKSIYLGNGETISITNIGKGSIRGKRNLYLNNLLRVPQIKKNLLSVSQFVKDNNVYFEFHPKFCLVRDLLNQEILLQGRLDQGLYKFSLTNIIKQTDKTNCCNHVEIIDDKNRKIFDMWHCKLRHPSIKVVKQIMKYHNISCNDISDSYVCTYCQLGQSHKLPFIDSTTTYNSLLELIAIDLSGSITNMPRLWLGVLHLFCRCFLKIYVDIFS